MKKVKKKQSALMSDYCNRIVLLLLCVLLQIGLLSGCSGKEQDPAVNSTSQPVIEAESENSSESDSIVEAEDTEALNSTIAEMYLELIQEYETKYGICYVSNDPGWAEFMYPVGLSYVGLIDFDGDGIEELLLVYGGETKDGSTGAWDRQYQYDVWGVRNGLQEKLYSGEANMGHPPEWKTLNMTQKDGKVFLIHQYPAEGLIDSYWEILGLQDGQFASIHTFGYSAFPDDPETMYYEVDGNAATAPEYDSITHDWSSAGEYGTIIIPLNWVPYEAENGNPNTVTNANAFTEQILSVKTNLCERAGISLSTSGSESAPYSAYLAILEDVIHKSTIGSIADRGFLLDADGDGMDELFLQYTTDGIDWCSAIYAIRNGEAIAVVPETVVSALAQGGPRYASGTVTYQGNTYYAIYGGLVGIVDTNQNWYLFHTEEPGLLIEEWHTQVKDWVASDEFPDMAEEITWEITRNGDTASEDAFHEFVSSLDLSNMIYDDSQELLSLEELLSACSGGDYWQEAVDETDATEEARPILTEEEIYELAEQYLSSHPEMTEHADLHASILYSGFEEDGNVYYIVQFGVVNSDENGAWWFPWYECYVNAYTGEFSHWS